MLSKPSIWRIVISISIIVFVAGMLLIRIDVSKPLNRLFRLPLRLLIRMQLVVGNVHGSVANVGVTGLHSGMDNALPGVDHISCCSLPKIPDPGTLNWDLRRPLPLLRLRIRWMRAGEVVRL